MSNVYLNIYEQPTPELTGNSMVQFQSTGDFPDYIVFGVTDGPAFLNDEQVQKVIAFLVTWRRLRAEGAEPNPAHPVFSAGR